MTGGKQRSRLDGAASVAGVVARPESGGALGRLLRAPAFRVVVGVGLLLALIGAVRASGILDGVDAAGIRDQVRAVGVWGPLLYVALFVVMILTYTPGFIPVAGGVFAYGPWWGGLLVLIGGTAANLAAYAIARYALGHHWTNFIRGRMVGLGEGRLKGLRERPLVGVILVRLILPTASAASFALAFAGVRLGTYLVGGLIGGLPQTIASIVMFAWAFSE